MSEKMGGSKQDVENGGHQESDFERKYKENEMKISLGRPGTATELGRVREHFRSQGIHIGGSVEPYGLSLVALPILPNGTYGDYVPVETRERVNGEIISLLKDVVGSSEKDRPRPTEADFNTVVEHPDDD